MKARMASGVTTQPYRRIVETAIITTNLSTEFAELMANLPHAAKRARVTVNANAAYGVQAGGGRAYGLTTTRGGSQATANVATRCVNVCVGLLSRAG